MMMNSKKTVASLSVGFTTGLGLLVSMIAFGSFIFSGPLTAYSSQGIGLILFGNFAACLIIALVGGFRGAISGLPAGLVIVMATIAQTLEAKGEALFITTVATFMIGSVMVGLCSLVIGYYRLSNLIRFIPYSVSSGFVAGIGGAVCLAAMSMMGAEPSWHAIPSLMEFSVLVKWAPGAVYGIILYLAIKRWNNSLILPLSFSLFVMAYHVAFELLGISGKEAREAGLLLGTTSDGGGLWPTLQFNDFALVDWTAMAEQFPASLTLILVAFICIIMNIAGLEMAANQELNWNREFRAVGFASIVSGLGGSMPASMIVPASLRSKLLGASMRLTGVIAALVIGSVVLWGDKILNYIPLPAIGGILFFAGAGMLDQGLVGTRNRLPRIEYGIILTIFFVIIAFGLFQGVGLGMLAALAFFAIRLSRTNVIESKFTLHEHRSSQVRSTPERAILIETGGRALGYRLHGYIFFGSIHPLVDRLRRHLSEELRPDFIIMDFKAVSGFDFSAVNVLCRFLRAAHSANVKMILCDLPEHLQIGLKRNLSSEDLSSLQVEPNIESALEACEDALIEHWQNEEKSDNGHRSWLFEQVSDDLEKHLERQIHFESLVEELKNYLNVNRYMDGEAIVNSESAGHGFQLLISGRASSYNSDGIRIRQYLPGNAIWLKGREDATTSITADEPCQTLVLGDADQEWLEQNKVQLVVDLYRYVMDEIMRIE